MRSPTIPPRAITDWRAISVGGSERVFFYFVRRPRW